MIDGILNNFTVNKQSNPLSTGVTTSNPAQTKAGNLESSPQTDTVSLSNKQPMSKKTKTILTLGGIATTVIGAVLAVKGFKSHKITKALEQIEQRFVKLKENVPEKGKELLWE
jgi:spermidine/putrescine-binding protein